MGAMPTSPGQKNKQGASFLCNGDSADADGGTPGGRIVQARDAQGLSTAQLARRLGVRTDTVRAWEADRSRPRANLLLRLSGMLNVSPTWLLTGGGGAPREPASQTEMMHFRATVERLRGTLLAVAAELEELEKRLDSYQSFQG